VVNLLLNATSRVRIQLAGVLAVLRYIEREEFAANAAGSAGQFRYLRPGKRRRITSKTADLSQFRRMA
jgi:hypothetical protein